MSTTSESYLVGLIGAGITASLTPPMHEAEAAHHGLHYLYRPVDLEAIGRPGTDVGELLRAGRDLGFNAFNITHPCKQLVLDHLHETTPAAAALKAVNTVLIRDGRFIGHNTDQTGFAAGLAAELPEAPKESVVQIGTGGAGSAVAAALLSQGVQALHLFDVDPTRAAERAQALGQMFPHQSVAAAGTEELPGLIAAADGVVNATPVGMHHHPGTPIDTSLLSARQWVADVIYLPVDTELITAARAAGCRVLDGGHMAVGQAADAFALITGMEPDRARMRAYFLELLHAQQG
ncbi:shikimate dehydrogenase [Kocuria dechangensis]|uniref:Quinate/shikimate dehydrogenase (NAD(+)) n=1 Tax=Kocuria dechangensis TaxID=1176249 RepID=A0A917H3M7_9MICC|nr:shikimate dehydrogenase [Kocuria dechangensis]GGG66405.1 shikimate dehydrogenase [Kocuria dechangensis]